ncbi:MAG: hypothetical protein IJ418_12125 [Clostridia bacterium]|nr:hypothetical protein [Clostridia bacterium]
MSNPILSRLNGAGRQQNRQTSNPLQEISAARRQGMSPMQFLQTRMQRTPQTQEAMKLLSGDENQLRTTAQRLAQQRGIDLDAFVQQVGFK